MCSCISSSVLLSADCIAPLCPVNGPECPAKGLFPKRRDDTDVHLLYASLAHPAMYTKGSDATQSSD